MENNKDIREIEIARLAFIGASIAAIGDGIAALAAGLELESLEKNYLIQSNSRHASGIESNITQLDYFINELIHFRNIVR